MIYEKAHAKINLALEVVKKRNDGYHDLKMIMIPLELHDSLSFKIDEKIILTSSVDIKDNQVLKTALLMKEKYKVRNGAHIHLDKHIPIGAGLAGGSADIAATIRGLNRLWSLNLDQKELENVALSLGSDTLFCLYQRPAYVFGRGEHIEFLDNPKADSIFLYYPNFISYTPYVFKHHMIKHKTSNFDRLLNMYKQKNWAGFYLNTFNDLLVTALTCYKELKKAHLDMLEIDENSMMSGSGSTFFIINSSQKDEDILAKANKNNMKLIKTSLKV